MDYSGEECSIIAADSFAELNYRQKRALMCATDKNNALADKCEQMLIKSLGGGVYNKVKARFLSPEYRAKIYGGLSKRGIVCVTLKSSNYPSQLANIPTPPLVLYCRGSVNLLSGECFAIVGSRRTPAATASACKRIAGEVARQMAIVTGVADGGDTAAILGALPSGRVICVLPGGHDCVNTLSNAALIKQVEERGLVISEFSPATAVQRYMFTVRNRIIAGLSRGVLVVSAPLKSGALITAGYAADYGRDVFAFPHSLGVSAGEGCNNLIKNGAMLCQNTLDILSAFRLEYKTEPDKLTKEEQAVLSVLRANGESHIQFIASSVNLQIFQAVTILSALEIKGLAVRCGGNKYSAV